MPTPSVDIAGGMFSVPTAEAFAINAFYMPFHCLKSHSYLKDFNCHVVIAFHMTVSLSFSCVLLSYFSGSGSMEVLDYG